MRRMFSEQQIKKMIEGNSTKLYLHFFEDESGTTWSMISTIKESFNGKTLSQIQAIFQSEKCLKFSIDSQLVIGLPNDTSDGFLYVSRDPEEITSDGDDFGSVADDEVTPL